jgi:ferrous-iron efflux pump FieF
MHYASDVLVNVGVIGSLVLVLTLGWVYVDSIVAIAIAGFVIYSAVRIARDALNHLMDRELPERDRRRILDIVQAHPKVTDCHDLRTRSAGLNAFIQVHVEMEGTLTLLEAHDISDEVEANIRKAFPNAEVIIHADPEGLEEEMPTFARL